jgi:hypothetical protein
MKDEHAAKQLMQFGEKSKPRWRSGYVKDQGPDIEYQAALRWQRAVTIQLPASPRELAGIKTELRGGADPCLLLDPCYFATSFIGFEG